MKRHPPAASRRTLLSQLARLEKAGDAGDLVLDDGATLHVSSLDKPYFPKAGVTKGGLMRYYVKVAPRLLPLLEGRPLSLQRFPDGVGGPSFHQQKAADPHDPAVRIEAVPTDDGLQPRFVGGSLATLLHTVQLGSIAVNPWHSRVGRIDHPDYAVLDFDPGPAVAYSRIAELARLAIAELDRRGHRAAAKTSGSRGLHLLVPLGPKATYDEAAALALEVAEALVALRPDAATVERALDARPAGTVYVDHMQNARGKTLASLWSVRARPAATVSAPVGPRSLGARLDPGTFTVLTVPGRLARLAAAWSAMGAPGAPATPGTAAGPRRTAARRARS